MRKQTLEQKLIHLGHYNPMEYLCKLYEKGLSANEISEKLLEDYKIKITCKHLSNKIGAIMPLRSYKERKLNAIKRGRMVYFKKPESMKDSIKSISIRTRTEVLYRDGFKCQHCGNSPANGAILELHHINGKESVMDNLLTLCVLCHRGLHAVQKKTA